MEERAGRSYVSTNIIRMTIIMFYVVTMEDIYSNAYAYGYSK